MHVLHIVLWLTETQERSSNSPRGFSHSTRVKPQMEIEYCTSSVQLTHIRKIITNILHLSMNSDPLSHVLAIIHSHLQGALKGIKQG